MKPGLIICMAIFLLHSGNSTAQILNPKKLLERKANKVIEQKTDQTLDSIIDGKPKPVAQTVTKEKKPEQIEKKATKPALDTIPALQTYSRYDFIPGEKIIFFEDFSQDNIGDFPALWNTNASAEVVTTNLFPGRWMKFSGRNAIWTDGVLKLPDNYTIEFDIIPIKGEADRMAGYDFRLIQSINTKSYDHGAVPGQAGFLFTCEYFGRTGYRTYINGNEGQELGLSGSKDDNQVYQHENIKYHIAIWVQKARIRLYQNEHKLFDLPKAFPLASVKMDRIRFEEGAAMVSNIRIAAGAPDMRNKLLTEGKLVSYGIYFDVNKDIVKPESYGTLKEIAAVLNDNPELKIKITGYTDADGADAANLDLSKRRAAAVKNEFVHSFAISAARIETDGKGELQPVAPNDTQVNKALNRRVEFTKF